MEALLSGLILAALGGITFIAYKHPTAFARLYPTLNVVLVCTSLGSLIWNTGSDYAAFSLVQFIPPANIEAAKAAVLARQIPGLGYILFGGLFGTLYLMFLSVLPLLLREKD